MKQDLDPNRHAMWMTNRVQAEIHDLPIEGKVPNELEGIFCTVGPESAFLPKPAFHHVPIHGDGMLSSVRIKNGKATYKSKYVMSDKLKAEMEAGKALFGAYRNPWTDDPGTEAINRHNPNTTVYQRADRIFVLKESMMPTEIDIETLETIGVQDFDGRDMPSPNMSAHEVKCPKTGEYFNVGTWAGELGSKKYALYRFSPDGSLTAAEVFEGPYSCMMHDFVITENYIVVPFFPTICDVERMKLGGPVWEWKTEEDAAIAIIPRNGSIEDIEWIKSEKIDFYAIHYFNAYEDGRTIVIDSIRQSFNFLFPPLDRDPGPFTCTAVRWRVNLDTKEVQLHDIHNHLTELPRIDERFIGKKYKYGFAPMQIGPNPFGHPYGFDTIARIDMDTDEIENFYLGDHALSQEFIFVPRSENADESDGFLMGYVNYPITNTTDLLIFDASNLPAGPVATIKIPYMVHLKVHGGWFCT